MSAFGDALDRWMARLRGVEPATPERACLGCDCTDDNACIGTDGEPCQWVGPQLCSCCVHLVHSLGLGE